MGNKIRKSTPPSINKSIAEAKKSAEKNAKELINFSLKYLQEGHEKFRYFPHEANYFIKLLERIRAISSSTKQELLSNRSTALRAHAINWIDSSETCFGFPEEDQIVDTPYQFSIGANQHGRVHGFFIYNTFYIVWLD